MLPTLPHPSRRRQQWRGLSIQHELSSLPRPPPRRRSDNYNYHRSNEETLTEVGLINETLPERRHLAIDEDEDVNEDDGDQETSGDNDEAKAGDSQRARSHPERMATMVQMLALMSVGNDAGLIALMETTWR